MLGANAQATELRRKLSFASIDRHRHRLHILFNNQRRAAFGLPPLAPPNKFCIAYTHQL